jgi:hypothetical protein
MAQTLAVLTQDTVTSLCSEIIMTRVFMKNKDIFDKNSDHNVQTNSRVSVIFSTFCTSTSNRSTLHTECTYRYTILVYIHWLPFK